MLQQVCLQILPSALQKQHYIEAIIREFSPTNTSFIHLVYVCVSMYPTISKIGRNSLICGITHCEEKQRIQTMVSSQVVRETSEIQTQSLLLSSSSHCSHKIGQLIKRRTVGTRNSEFIWKVSRLQRWWTSIPKNHLAWIWVLISVPEQR